MSFYHPVRVQRLKYPRALARRVFFVHRQLDHGLPEAVTTNMATLEHSHLLALDPDHHVPKADVLLHRACNPYIDDRADVQRSADKDDQYEDDEDSSEAQIRRADEEEFDMHGILADHDARVLSAAPYRIPERLLQSGAETLSRGEEWDFDMAPSRATSVMPAWHPPPHAGSRAPTPSYGPANHPSPESTPAEARRARTPLFLPDPDLRGPTPFQPRDSRDFTPYVSPLEARELIASSSSGHRRPASSSPPPAAKRVRTASPLRDEARAQCVHCKIAKYLDTIRYVCPHWTPGISEDSCSEFIDDTPLQIHDLPPFHDAADDDDEQEADAERLQEIAAHFESQAHNYSASAAREAGISRLSHSAPPKDDAALAAVVSSLLPSSSATVRRAGLRAETQSQMEHRLKSLLPAENKKTVVPGSWIRFKDHLVFVLGPKKLLMAKARDIPLPPAPAPNKRQQTAKSGKKKEQDVVPDLCCTNELGRELYQMDYPEVHPSIDELGPFRTSRCQALQRQLFSGPSQALEAGDRVLIVGGARRGETAYVRHMQELRGPRGGSRQVCELSPHFPASEDAFVCPVASIVRHILSPSPPLHIFDHVRVNSGALYRGAIGRLMSIDGPQVTVALPAETNFDEALPSKMQPDGTRHIDVPMEDINRHFVLGDVVFIVRGENKNRHGLVVHIHSNGSLEVFQTGYGLEVMEDVDVGPASTLNGPGRSIVKRHKTGQFDLHDYQDDSEFRAVPIRVMRADVNFLMFDEDQLAPNCATRAYTKMSVVEPPRVRPALPHLQKDQVRQVREYQRAAETDDRLAYDAKKAANEAVQNKMLQLEPPASFAELHQKIFERDRDKAAAFGSWEKKPETDYTGIYVQVAYQGNNKGFRGQVISTYHTPARYERLKSQKRRRFMEGDTQGIMVTIRNDSNRQVSEPIEKVVHDMTRLPLAQARYLPPRVLYAPRLMTPSSPEPRAVTPPLIPADAAAEEAERLALEEAARQRAIQFEEHRLPGELDGRWLLMPGLVGKRVDVDIRGLLGFTGTRDIPRLSLTLVSCEGSRGTLLLTEGQTEVSLRKSVTVYHVGPKRRPLGFPASCIKPARTDTDGVDILTRIQRVVVLGPNVTEDTSLVVIRVNGTSPVFFHTLHLCLAKNEKAGEVLPATFPH
ncbi:hypothetical protein DFH09DRAFT_1092218 [Mycena vulgaris]|nr:hypothetical protein DFH09DRAFT_1092218 [Mycena vulgaris]